MPETSLPSTWTLPSEGLSNPAAIFNDSVLPVPVSPSNTSVSRSCTSNETPRKMSPSSKPMRTPSNLMAGLESVFDVTALVIGRVPVIITAILPSRGLETHHAGPRVDPRALEKLVGEEQRHFGEKCIGHDDHDGRQHGRLRGGPADTLSTSAHGQPFVAAEGCENECEEKRLGKSLHQVRKIQGIDGATPELNRAEAQRKNRSYATAH